MKRGCEKKGKNGVGVKLSLNTGGGVRVGNVERVGGGGVC